MKNKKNIKHTTDAALTWLVVVSLWAVIFNYGCKCVFVCLCVCTHIFTYSFYLFPLVFLIHKPKEKIRCCDHHAERTRWVALISSFSHSGMRLKASYKSHQVSQPVLHLVDILWSLWLASCCLGLTLFLSS